VGYKDATPARPFGSAAIGQFGRIGRDSLDSFPVVGYAVHVPARHAPVAQWIEQPPPKRKVASSTLAGGTTGRTRSLAVQPSSWGRFLAIRAGALALAAVVLAVPTVAGAPPVQANATSTGLVINEGPRDPADTVSDQFQQMIDDGLVHKPLGR
jgi:hypothetical protein